MKSMMKRLTAAAGVLVLLISISLTCDAQKKSTLKATEGALVDAVTLFDDAQYSKALPMLEAICTVSPSNDAAWYYRGLCEAYLGDSDNAIAHVREASRLDPSNYWYRDRLARLYAGTGQLEAAADIYESLAKDFPKNNEIYYTLVRIYLQLGNSDKLISTVEEIETVSGRDEMTVLTRYDALMRLGRQDEAYSVLEQYNDEFSSARILCAMGDYNIARFRDTLALDNYTEALSYEAGNPQALLGISEVYRYRSDYPNYFASVNSFITGEQVPLDAKSRYMESLFRHTDGAFFRNFKANLDLLVENYVAQAPADTLVGATASSYYYNTGNSAKALETISYTVETNPTHISSRALQIQLLSLMEDWDALDSACEKAWADFPEEPGFLEMKTYADYHKKDYDTLIADCERLIAAAPRDTAVIVRALSTIGDTYYMKGDSRRAFSTYEKALKIDPGNCPILNNYAYYLSLEGRKLKKAYAMSKITIEKEPDNATYLDTFGWILFLQGKALEAKPFFKHAMLYGGKDSIAILDHYAEVLYALKEYDLARVYWNMAKAKNENGEIPDLDARVDKKLKAIDK